MSLLPGGHPLSRALRELLPADATWPELADVRLEPLPSSRQVVRFSVAGGNAAAVGKFFSAYPPATEPDRSLDREYGNYLWAAALGLTQGPGLIPRLLGRHPQTRLGLVLAAVPGPDLDRVQARACQQGDHDQLHRRLEKLAGLLAVFHTRPLPEEPVSPEPALGYLAKLRCQLQGLGLLTSDDELALEEESRTWAGRLSRLPDRLVLVHGDATPTNFLFPDGRVVALDLERLRAADRLWDLSWVAGELKHAWGLRTEYMDGAEPAIRHFFGAYLTALPAAAPLIRRIFALNPFYMALAELRIARNPYLPWEHRRALVAEARRCLAGGRSLDL
ncbi:MAG: aminoglycoside phosphotransferase family protein [Thermodesulfobacteriota bacterium]